MYHSRPEDDDAGPDQGQARSASDGRKAVYEGKKTYTPLSAMQSGDPRRLKCRSQVHSKGIELYKMVRNMSFE
jgi:hypothetical protein